MALYEHVLIARQDLSTSQAEGLIEHFGQILTDNSGKVLDTEYWGLKTMAYKINKNRKGHYAFFRTDAPSDAVQEMERLARLHEDVMRVINLAHSLVRMRLRSTTKTLSSCSVMSLSVARSCHPVSPPFRPRSSVNWPVQLSAPVSSHFCPTPRNKEKRHGSYSS